MLSRLAALALLVFAPLLRADEPAPLPAVSSLDFFGLRQVSETDARTALGLKEGDEFDRNRADALATALKERLHLQRVTIAPIRTGSDGIHVFVGIQEQGGHDFVLLAPPTGDVRLPAPLLNSYRDLLAALPAAVTSGNAREDDSQGHALTIDAAMRRAQEAALTQMHDHEALVKTALHDSASAEDRRAAAWLLGYAPDKTTVTDDLIRAARDPDAEVRNNATRSLGAIAVLASRRPELGIHIDPSAFIAMLGSVDWTDRNKASFVLMGLTQSRDATLLQRLKREALPELVEMARWKSAGHAFAPALILGRVAGWDDPRIFAALGKGDRDAIIAAANQP